MITSSGDVIYESGSIEKFTTPDTYCDPQYFQRTGDIVVNLRVVPTGSTTITSANFIMRITKSQVDAKTGTGTGDTAKWQNAVEQVVKDNLVALNSGVTFTIV
ncbi:MAG: hypothetical protein EBR82_29275 [Caulobacteraceae bacterium]|nr:hypothetical protein [Caulobacteraceae bacterium]